MDNVFVYSGNDENMDDGGTETGHGFDFLAEERELKRARWTKFLHSVILFTFGLAFLFLIMSVFLSLDPSWGASLSQSVNPYFFFLLLVASSPSAVPISIIFVVMFALYLIFFSVMTERTVKHRKDDLLDTPAGYFIIAGSAVFLIVSIIALLEEIFGTPIGGQGIDQELQNNPLLGYMSLIYAPFVEELGFRILPLGIFSFFVVLAASIRSRKDSGITSFLYSLLAIVAPGYARKRYNVRMNAGDWVLIIITSIIFGYAHIYFGAWDWGKFLPVFITGIALAVGFLKFGAYVDIPLHWFFNGFLTLGYLNASFLFAGGLITFWLFFVGAVSLVAIIVYTRDRIGRARGAPTYG